MNLHTPGCDARDGGGPHALPLAPRVERKEPSSKVSQPYQSYYTTDIRVQTRTPRRACSCHSHVHSTHDALCGLTCASRHFAVFTTLPAGSGRPLTHGV
eukprot:scaffold2348_cov66-Phaeocystis_antarctica.AAC.7